MKIKDLVLLILLHEAEEDAENAKHTWYKKNFYKRLSALEKQRQFWRIPRALLHNPINCAWRQLYKSKNDGALITLTGFDFKTFNWLSELLVPISTIMLLPVPGSSTLSSSGIISVVQVPARYKYLSDVLGVPHRYPQLSQHPSCSSRIAERCYTTHTSSGTRAIIYFLTKWVISLNEQTVCGTMMKFVGQWWSFEVFYVLADNTKQQQPDLLLNFL
jgi:hypothetical protein